MSPLPRRSGTAVAFVGCLLAFSARAESHPRCEVAWEYSYVKTLYGRIVKGRPEITIKEEDGLNRSGVIWIRDPKYKKWPRGHSRPAELIIPFSFDANNECDWFPDPKKRKFILDVRDGALFIVTAY